MIIDHLCQPRGERVEWSGQRVTRVVPSISAGDGDRAVELAALTGAEHGGEAFLWRG